MTETHVVSALRVKRSEISAHIHDLEKRIARQRVALASLDATIRLFSPDTNPDAILAKRPYRHTRYFGRNELSRLVMDALPLATGPLAAADIATAVMRAKGATVDDEAFKADRHRKGAQRVARSRQAWRSRQNRHKPQRSMVATRHNSRVTCETYNLRVKRVLFILFM